MIVFAEVGYYEAWWIQLLKAVVIFAIVFNLVPIALRYPSPCACNPP